jgi:hypothetical protein
MLLWLKSTNWVFGLLHVLPTSVVKHSNKVEISYYYARAMSVLFGFALSQAPLSISTILTLRNQSPGSRRPLPLSLGRAVPPASVAGVHYRR